MIKSLGQPFAKTTKITKTKELRKQKTLQGKKNPSAGLVSHHPKLEEIETLSYILWLTCQSRAITILKSISTSTRLHLRQNLELETLRLQH